MIHESIGRGDDEKGENPITMQRDLNARASSRYTTMDVMDARVRHFIARKEKKKKTLFFYITHTDACD